MKKGKKKKNSAVLQNCRELLFWGATAATYAAEFLYYNFTSLRLDTILGQIPSALMAAKGMERKTR